MAAAVATAVGNVLFAVVVISFIYGILANAFRHERGYSPRASRARRPAPAELLASLVPDRERELQDQLDAWDEAIAEEVAASDRLALARRGV